MFQTTIYHFKRNKNGWLSRPKKKSCYFTDNKIEKIDWTDYELLRRFISDRGKILPSRDRNKRFIRDNSRLQLNARGLLPFVAKEWLEITIGNYGFIVWGLSI